VHQIFMKRVFMVRM